AREEGGVVSPITNEGIPGSVFFTTIIPKDRVEPLKAKLTKLGLTLHAEIQEQFGANVNRAATNNTNGLANNVFGDEKNLARGGLGGFGGGGGGLGGGVGGVTGGGRAGGLGVQAPQQNDGINRDRGIGRQGQVQDSTRGMNMKKGGYDAPSPE